MSAHLPITHRSRCCLCASPDLDVVLPLEPSPIGDDFARADDLDRSQPLLPLDVGLCRTCGHLQLMDLVEPAALFVDYLYQTQTSPGLVAHFREFAAAAVARWQLAPGDVVYEIGSNDGALLHFFQEAGLTVQGIDPAKAPGDAARARGIPTEAAFFDPQVARRLRDQRGPAKLVVANNVFAHSDRLAEMAEGVRGLLASDGVFAFEVSYVPDLIDRKLFDTIYHEHVSYHSIQPLQRFLPVHGLELFDVERIAAKGGSIRGLAQLAGGPQTINPRVETLVAQEAARGFGEPAIYRQFAAELVTCRNRVHALLDSCHVTGATLVGYGASPTVSTLIAHFRLADRIGYLVDDNPLKQGRYSPHWHHPVEPSRVLIERQPPVTITLAWNYADAMIARQSDYRARGGRFVVPLPEPRTV